MLTMGRISGRPIDRKLAKDASGPRLLENVIAKPRGQEFLIIRVGRCDLTGVTGEPRLMLHSRARNYTSHG